MVKHQVVYRHPDDLKLWEGNPRTHSRKQIDKIAKSITKFGFLVPLLTDKDSRVIAGNGRLQAARLLGLTDVPTICLADMPEAEARAYLIADNRIAQESGWDNALLSAHLDFLTKLEEDFDLSLTGLDLPEVDALLATDNKQNLKDDPTDAVPPLAQRAVTRIGDIWNIGSHRLICGDATKDETFLALLGEAKARMVFTDPPWNVPIDGHVSGLGAVHHREFVMASGEMTDFEFQTFLFNVFSNLMKYSVDGSIHYQCIDWAHLEHMLAAASSTYGGLKNLCVWVKNNAGMGSLYRSQHELVCVFKSGNAPHVNNVALGKNGRHRTNVWSHPGANSFGRTRDSDLAMHPTVKPVAMVMDAIRDCSHQKDAILDPFCGSGTTLVAAQRTKRVGFGVELDPLYCDVIVRRMQSLFKLDVVLEGDGRSFDQVADERLSALEQELAA